MLNKWINSSCGMFSVSYDHDTMYRGTYTITTHIEICMSKLQNIFFTVHVLIRGMTIG